ncbi:MAG: M15 family metallopeptidase [Kofleriaceae bacterium]
MVDRPRVRATGRGAAVDVSLADERGAALAMPTDHDDFSPAAGRARALAGADPRAERARRLDEAMRAAGFEGIASEWWHFQVLDGERFALADLPLPP